MTKEEVDSVLDLVDKLAVSTGQRTIRSLLAQFSDIVPSDIRTSVMAQVTEDTAKNIRDGLNKTLKEMQRTIDDPLVLEALRKVVTPNEHADNLTGDDSSVER